jgi:hypothetical protein
LLIGHEKTPHKKLLQRLLVRRFAKAPHKNSGEDGNRRDRHALEIAAHDVS